MFVGSPYEQVLKLYVLISLIVEAHGEIIYFVVELIRYISPYFFLGELVFT